MFRKVLIYVITVFFFLQYIGGAVPIYIEGTPSIEKEIFIPESYGVIERSSFDKYPSSRLVVLLKDAHCNYDAQHNIARILEVLVRDYKVDLVAVEGAVGFLDYTRLEKLENEIAREKMADTFVKKGILSGPEYLKITKDGRLLFNIYGIEDEKLYIENFIAFRQTIDHMEETFAYINELDRVVKSLKKKIYLPGLLEFDNKATQYYENAISLTDWVKELKAYGDKLGMTLKEYPNILITLDSIELEDRIDFKKVELERASAIGELEKVLSQEELKEMVTKSLQFRLGKIFSKDYYKYLEELLGVDAETKYPNLSRYIQLVKLQSWINNDALFGEIERLENVIKETMFRNDVQRQLDDISKKARILNGLFKLTLTRKDIDYYKAHKEEFLPSNMLSFINIQAPSHNIPVSMLLTDDHFLNKVTSVIMNGEKFYDIAIQRDENLVENTLRVMEEKQKSNAVMVIGGFHTDGVVNLFEEKGVGYVVISPKIVKAEKEGLYISLMMDKRITLAQKTSSLAFPKLLADGPDNNRLIIKLGVSDWHLDLIDSALKLYKKFRGRGKAVEGLETPSLPFRIKIGEDGVIAVERNPDYTDPEIPDQMLEWFRLGLEEVLNANPTLKEFITKENNLEKYLDRTAFLEYKFRTAGARQEGILRRATLGFIAFYLGLCKAYSERGFLSLPEDIREGFLPESIRRLEFGEGVSAPGFKSELISELKKKGIVDEGVVEGIVNYLFTMPAYGYDEETKEFYQTLYFSSYVKLVKDVFGVAKDERLKGLFDRLQAYRFLQIYLGKMYKKPEDVERLARYLSGEDFSEDESGDLKNLLNRKIPEWREMDWVKVAGGVSVINESSIKDPLKRDVYVAVLARANVKGGLDVIDKYMQEKMVFEEKLPTYDEAIAKLKNRTFTHEISMYLGDVREVSRGRYEYNDLGSANLDLIRAIQRSKDNSQYFIYKTNAEKEAMKAYLALHEIKVEDKQFITKEEYKALDRTGRIIVTLLKEEGTVEGVEGDRILIGNPEGTDLMLMNRLALVIAEPNDLEKEKERVQNTIRPLLTKYYRGTIGQDEIDKLVEGMTKDLFKITLPPITPFVKEYYNMLMQAREVIAKAA